MPKELRNIDSRFRGKKFKKLTSDAQRTEKARLRQAASAWREHHVWNPNQLRHTRGIDLRHEYGIEAAQTVLGHANLDTTEIYAEANFAKARTIMAAVG